MPYLDARTRELAGMGDPRNATASGTWTVGSHPQPGDDDDDDDDDAGEPRFALSDSEAPTVRPGILRAAAKSSW